jgi:hypothetical protein
MLVDSIRQPIRFQHEQEARYNRTIERLKDIRTAQLGIPFNEWRIYRKF